MDAGQIKVGMETNAVYIAWGKPSQILKGETAHGPTMTWLYQGTYLVPYHYWAGYGYGCAGRYYTYPYLATDYYPRNYLRSEVVFENGLVKEWRSLPSPPH